MPTEGDREREREGERECVRESVREAGRERESVWKDLDARLQCQVLLLECSGFRVWGLGFGV